MAVWPLFGHWVLGEVLQAYGFGHRAQGVGQGSRVGFRVGCVARDVGFRAWSIEHRGFGQTAQGTGRRSGLQGRVPKSQDTWRASHAPPMDGCFAVNE